MAETLAEVVTTVQALLGRGATPDELRAASTQRVRVDGLGRLQVYVVLTEVRPEHVARLEALGADVELTLPENRLVQAWVPALSIRAVEELPFVVEVRPPGYPAPRSR
ncbi:MAG TPA: hypothetical protein VK548_07050 [Candidatus Acidoferrum sp.]|nr:hypothetical protein [Candidatus Acidoferrum sp.]